MEWLINHWWILVLVFLVGVMINVIKILIALTTKSFSPISRSCRPIAIVTISGTMTTTGRSTTSRRSKTPGQSPPPESPDSGVIRLIRE
jgi:hypothetical protein